MLVAPMRGQKNLVQPNISVVNQLILKNILLSDLYCDGAFFVFLTR